MAQLGSPGVQVNVIDESFYNPATPGTVPLVVLATAQNKTNAAGTGTAIGTTSANANTLYLATSQKDLTDRYGIPTFEKDASGNAVQGSELNEYGLFAAYSYLAASNSAYILRAPVDLAALKGRATAPVGSPDANSWWLDLSKTRFGAFEWNKDLQQFVNKVPLILNKLSDVEDTVSYKPKTSVGTVGDYAVVTFSASGSEYDGNTMWYKNRDSNWVKVGSRGLTTFAGNTFKADDWSSSWPVVSSKAFGVLSVTAVTYNQVSATGGSGNGATFNVVRSNGAYTVTVYETSSGQGTGSGYQNNDVLTIPGTAVGGTSPANNISITINGVAGGVIHNANFQGQNGSVTGTAVTVSDIGAKITVGNYDRSGTAFVVNYKVDGGTDAGGGEIGATVTEIATQLNAIFSGAPNGSPGKNVAVRIRDGKLEFVAKQNVYVKFEAPDSGTSMLGANSTFGVAVGTYNAPAVQFSEHTKVPFWSTGDTMNANNSERPTGSIWVKTTEYNLGAKWTIKRFNGDTLLFETKDSPVYAGTAEALAKMDPLGGGTNLTANALFVNANFNQNTDVDFRIMYRAVAGSTSAQVSGSAVTNYASNGETVTIAETVKGSATLNQVTVTLANNDDAGDLATKILAAGLVNIDVAYDEIAATFKISHKLGGEIFLSGDAWGDLGFASATNVYNAPSGSAFDYRISNWKNLSTPTVGYYVDSLQPSSNPVDGTLWYASYQNQVDLMVHDGTKWVGYAQALPDLINDDVIGPYVQATKPTTRRNGFPLIVGEIWIDTSVQDNYGKVIKRYRGGNVWDPVDTTDHTSQYGIIYADARWGTTGASSVAGDIGALAKTSYIDPDAPDPTAYPRGMLLWNTRRSGFNIKQYRKGVIDTAGRNIRFNIDPFTGLGESMSGYFADRWVSVSGTDLNQVAYFGRKAQRAYVVGQLKVAINTNQRILDEDNIFFNLIACPGYPELISDMVNLNNTRNGTALVIGDTPMRLESNANSLVQYGSDYLNTGIDGESGLHTNNDHLAIYYPSGLSTDLSGTNVVVPPSHMMLRTIAVSDQRSFQWFAPAGTRRGGITNATSVGYLKDGSFIPVSLNQATRDQMATVKINPITNIPGAGLVAFGQYTKTGVNSSLDRINVARLVSYLRRQLGIITKPFLFEPNDKQTRSEIKNVCESLLLDLVSLRGIYDFIVQCDEQNNTPSVIANNQLYVDIAVEPVKAVEFIYIPLRLKNVGDIKARQ